MHYFEDVPLGETTEIGSYTFTEEDIITFAKKYDPQPFHVDPEFANSHEFGGLVASGFHTAAIWMKLMIAMRDELTTEIAEHEEEARPRGGASPGFLKMRWPNPVRPGDTIAFANTTHKKIELRSRQDVGILQTKTIGRNQDGKVVLSFIGQGLWPRRPSAR